MIGWLNNIRQAILSSKPLTLSEETPLKQNLLAQIQARNSRGEKLEALALFKEKLSNFPKQTLYALQKMLPKNAKVCAVAPKEVLTEILPQLAALKKLDLSSVGRRLPGTPFLAELPEADFYLFEPVALTPDGALVLPEERKYWQPLPNVLVCGLALSLTSHNSNLDHVLLPSDALVVSELGAYRSEHFSHEVKTIYPWLPIQL
jgi:hypothetical protein